MKSQIAQQLADRLNKVYWRRDLEKRGHERTPPVSPQLSEALRNEIRIALEADGKPFDVNVARRVYDLAISARDMCVAASSSVKEAIDQIKDTNGPMETLDSPDTPESAMQASETFGGRLIRELMAALPLITKPKGEDPKALVHAIAEARAKGMTDVAAALEVKLFGRVLTAPIDDGVAVGGYEQGYADGKIGASVAHTNDNYREGYKDGTTERFLEPVKELPTGSAVREHVQQHPGTLPKLATFLMEATGDPAGEHPVPEGKAIKGYKDETLSRFLEPEPGYEYQRAKKIADVRVYAPTPDSPCQLCGHPAGSLHKAGCGSNTSDDELDRLALIARGWIAPCSHPTEARRTTYQGMAGDQGGMDYCNVCGSRWPDEEVAGRKHARPPSGMENAFVADSDGEQSF